MKTGIVLALAALTGGMATAQTAVQIAAGRASYQARCTGCHGTDLGGSEAPQLAGTNFRAEWGTRSANELVNYIHDAMPPGLAGTMSAEESASLAAFIMAANGAAASDRAVGADSNFAIRSVAAGQPTTALQGGGGGGARPSAARGLTVAGTVKNYAPVTDAMLKNPDPGDWLMIRRNYQAWSYSPLAQVTASNVKDLQLVWSWAMNEGGANEPTPIVHNGIMFLGNTGNVVQALDARTGDLIWENRLGPEVSNGLGAIRSLAVYQDKVYVAATDSRLVALDARTGKQVWETRIGDPAKGYGNTSGPIVVGGKVSAGHGRVRPL